MPEGLHEIVTDFAYVLLAPDGALYFTDALAVAVLPDLLEVTLVTDQYGDGALDFGLQLVHFEVEPSYVKVAVIDSDHKIVPELFFREVVLVLVIVLEDDNRLIWEGDSEEIIVS